MEFDIQRFSTNVSRTPLLKSSNFLFTCNKPAMLASENIDNNRLSMLCRAATTPGVALQTTEEKPWGQGTAFKMPKDALHSDITLTFYVDAQYSTYDLFLAWLKGIIPSMRDLRTPFNGLYDGELRYHHEYVADIHIAHYTENSKIAKFTLYDAYPINITEINLDWGLGEELSAFSVTFTYRAFKLQRIDETITVSQVETAQRFGSGFVPDFRQFDAGASGTRSFPVGLDSFGTNSFGLSPTSLGSYALSDPDNPFYGAANVRAGATRAQFANVTSAFDYIVNGALNIGTLVASLSGIRRFEDQLNSSIAPFLDLINAGTDLVGALSPIGIIDLT